MIEQIVKWTICGFMALGALLTVGSVGKRKTPTTGGIAAFVVIVDAAMIAAIAAWWD